MTRSPLYASNAVYGSSAIRDRFEWRRDVPWYRLTYWLLNKRWRLHNVFESGRSMLHPGWRSDKQHARAQLARQFDPDWAGPNAAPGTETPRSYFPSQGPRPR